MRREKRVTLFALAVIVVLATWYVVTPGFFKQGISYIVDYSVPEDGTEMTITVGVPSSIGYIRKVLGHQQHGGKLYLDCYSAFGGINGHWGAKSEYTIQIDEQTKIIALYRSANCYEPVLEKNENGEWQRVKAQ